MKTGRPCDTPATEHDGLARLYPCGWRCTTHAPQPRTVPVKYVPKQAASPAAPTEGAQAA